jgi:hypothetical protein
LKLASHSKSQKTRRPKSGSSTTHLCSRTVTMGSNRRQASPMSTPSQMASTQILKLMRAIDRRSIRMNLSSSSSKKRKKSSLTASTLIISFPRRPANPKTTTNVYVSRSRRPSSRESKGLNWKKNKIQRYPIKQKLKKIVSNNNKPVTGLEYKRQLNPSQ